MRAARRVLLRRAPGKVARRLAQGPPRSRTRGVAAWAGRVPPADMRRPGFSLCARSTAPQLARHRASGGQRSPGPRRHARRTARPIGASLGGPGPAAGRDYDGNPWPGEPRSRPVTPARSGSAPGPRLRCPARGQRSGPPGRGPSRRPWSSPGCRARC